MAAVPCPGHRAAIAAGTVLIGLIAACGTPDPGPRPSPASDTPSTWFTDVTADAGIDFLHSGGAAGSFSTPEITGSGGALFDYDGDGDLDVYLVDVAGTAARPRVNRLYRQDSPGRFTEVTTGAGIGDPGYGMGVALGDVDNDGDQDLFVSNMGPDALYLNSADGTFRRAETAGVERDLWSTSACFLDYDRDGRLDLYVATYLQFDPTRSCTDQAGNPEFCGPTAFRGVPDLLYRGHGDGTFTEVSRRVLAGRPVNKALGVICADLDGDRLTDVYVANDGEQNQLWINRGDGTFAERALLLGVGLNLFGKPEASMGAVAGDLDGDLDPDIFLTHLDRETNTVYANLGEAGFEDRTPASGLGPAGMPHTGFGTALLDADLDGDLDLAVVNGRVRRGASLSDRERRRRTWRRAESVPAALADYVEPNQFFLNEGGGRFHEASVEAWGTDAVAARRGLLAGDLDGDGDPDLLVTNCGSRAQLLRNDLPGTGHWLDVRVVENRPGPAAAGASVHIEAGGRAWRRPLASSHGYLTATQPLAHFGLGDSPRVARLTVEWPDGARTAFSDLPTDRSVRITRGAAASGSGS